MSIVIGIDPSLTSTGIAMLDTQDRLDIPTCTIGSSGKRNDGWPTRLGRIEAITTSIRNLIPASADLAVMEAPSLGQTRQGGHFDRHGLWWSIYQDLTHVACLPVLVVPPAARAKYATGKGNAGKDEVLLAVARRYPQAEVVNNDEADATILAAIGARILDDPIEDHLPRVNLDAMAKLVAPVLGGAA